MKNAENNKKMLAGVIAVACALLSLFGFEVSEDTQSIITDNLASIGAALGSLYAIFAGFKSSGEK